MTADVHPRILIVDDEPRNIRLLQGILYAEPYQVLSAKSGPEAWEIVQRDAPDVILLDIMMPGMSGYDLCRQIKSAPEYRMIPVVMVTALHEVSDRVRALEAGADDFLSKPVDASELIVRVRTLLRLRQLYADVEHMTAERLRFMAGIAHDIRSPLDALSLTLEQIAEKIPVNPSLDRLWSRVALCIERIRILASDMMNYYRIEAGNLELFFEPCPISKVVQDATNIAAQIAEDRQITLIVNDVPDLVIALDRDAIPQILLNLLTNALKYTDEGGIVTFKTYDLSKNEYALPLNHYPPVIALPVSGVVFEIQDTGKGIAPDEFDKVFGEFARLKAARDTDVEGVGLGLAVSQRLVRLHSGEIWFTSTVGQGSTFAFFLPKEHPAAGEMT